MKASRIVTGSIALIGLAAVSSNLSLADGPEAVATAAQHAGLAAGSDGIEGVRLHLHHTLNCLVGEDGEGFDESAGNPCAGTGGAIPQTGDAVEKQELEKIAMQVSEALGNDDAAAAKETAMSVQEMLE